MSLRRGAKDALTTTPKLASYATLRTLESSPRVDANPWAARVRRAGWLLLLHLLLVLAAVGPPVPPAALLLLRWTLLLLLLQRRGRRRRQHAGGTAARRGGDQGRGGGHLCLIRQAQLLEGERSTALEKVIPASLAIVKGIIVNVLVSRIWGVSYVLYILPFGPNSIERIVHCSSSSPIVTWYHSHG